MIKPIAHTPQEWAVFVIVTVVCLVGIVVLLRLILAGAGSMGRTPLPAKQYRRILLPAASEAAYTREALTLACRLAGRGSQGNVVLTYIIEVPRSLAPEADMPEEEQEAERVLAQAEEIVRGCGVVPTRRIRKGRGAVEETLRAVQEEKADLLVMEVPENPRDPTETHPFQKLTSELARKAPCEVVLTRTHAV